MSNDYNPDEDYGPVDAGPPPDDVNNPDFTQENDLGNHS